MHILIKWSCLSKILQKKPKYYIIQMCTFFSIEIPFFLNTVGDSQWVYIYKWKWFFHFTNKQVFAMDLALCPASRPLSPESGHFCWNSVRPVTLRRTLGPRRAVIVMAQKKEKIEGVSDQLNSIASQNLDQAMARRRVRSAFSNVQQHLDHILLKVFFDD